MLFFAAARDQAGTGEIELQLPNESTVGDLRLELARRFLNLGATLARSMIAVNQEYADNQTVLSDGDEAACIPPVSGGAVDARLCE